MTEVTQERRITFAAFIEKHAISMEVERAESNPTLELPEEFALVSTHWWCALSRGGNRLDTYYSMGAFYRGRPPTVEEVFRSLAYDSAAIEESVNFEEWAENSEYDPDSRRAERLYNLCCDQAKRLQTFLGREAYNELLWETDTD